MSNWQPRMRQPSKPIPYSKHSDPDGIEYVVPCFSCGEKFKIRIGYSTYLFECPHCKKMNELEE